MQRIDQRSADKFNATLVAEMTVYVHSIQSILLLQTSSRASLDPQRVRGVRIIQLPSTFLVPDYDHYLQLVCSSLRDFPRREIS